MEEGQIHRLKAAQPQTYGRAGHGLLSYAYSTGLILADADAIPTSWISSVLRLLRL